MFDLLMPFAACACARFWYTKEGNNTASKEAVKRPSTYTGAVGGNKSAMYEKYPS